MRRTLLLICILTGSFATGVHASELKPETVVAFDRYVRATEARMKDDLRQDHFLAIDRLPDSRQRKAYDRVQNGALYIAKVRTLEDGRAIEIPGGLIHHWVAVIFVPGIRLSEALAVLQDYDDHQIFYKPDVRKSKLLERSGDDFKIYLQFYEKSIVTAVFNANFDVKYEEFGSTQLESASRSTRVAEVQDLGKPDERELPVGKDRGFLWRLNSYWRVEEKDGGVYLQNESIALTRRVPPLLAWLVNPLLESIPRNTLSKLLFGTRDALVKAKSTSTEGASSVLSLTSNASGPGGAKDGAGAGDALVCAHTGGHEPHQKYKGEKNWNTVPNSMDGSAQDSYLRPRPR